MEEETQEITPLETNLPSNNSNTLSDTLLGVTGVLMNAWVQHNIAKEQLYIWKQFQQEQLLKEQEFKERLRQEKLRLKQTREENKHKQKQLDTIVDAIKSLEDEEVKKILIEKIMKDM